MLADIQSILSEVCKLDSARPVLAGVSGGPDSLCLLELLRQAGYPVIAAHFNHRLRPEADEEERAVAGAAQRVGLQFVSEGADVGAYAEAESSSIEEAARTLRYRFLFSKARALGAQAVAVGHTADDQVETVLMHFLRGAGLAGLKGMTYRSLLAQFDPEIPLVRPLLNLWREDTLKFCEDNRLHPHFDPSNESNEFLRNRLRNELIPRLEGYNPKFKQAVWRTAQSLLADQEVLAEVLAREWEMCVIEQVPDYIEFDLDALRARAAGLQRNLIRQAVEHLILGQEVDYATLMRASAFIADPTLRRVDLTGGLRLLREGEALYVAAREVELPFDGWPQMPFKADSLPVCIPGRLDLAGGWSFSADELQNVDQALNSLAVGSDPFQVWLDAEILPDTVELRVRRSGDRFQPLGLQGHSQKLSDFFVNAKVPQRARTRWPLLCAGDEVIWVPGHRPAEPYKMKAGSTRLVHFAAHPPFES